MFAVALRRPWAWLWIYALAFAVAIGALWFAAGMGGDALPSAISGVVYLLLCAITARVSAKAVPEHSLRGMLLGLQLFVLASVAVFTAVDGLYFHHLSGGIPLWTTLHFALYQSAGHLFNDRAFGLGLANATLYVLVPLIVLVLLRVPLASLGFGRFQPKAAIIAAIWLTPVVIAEVWGAVASGSAVPVVLHRILTDVLQNGASEEFLFRGAILSRLRLVMRDDLAVLAQAVVFGLWHVGADLSGFKGNAGLALAEAIAVQTTFGLAMGYLTLRTGNIAIGSLFHALIDAVG